MKKLIITFINMKVLPLFLSMFNVGFWIFFRSGKTLFKEFPMTQVIKQENFQYLVFLFLGITLYWSFYSFSTKKKEYCMLMTAMSGVGLSLFFKGYDLVGEYFKGKSYYTIIAAPVLICIIIGAGLAYMLCILFRTDYLKNIVIKQKEEIRLSVQNIANYRSHMMGIAMLYIMLFHTKTMKVNYNNEFLATFVETGYLGVDIFVFLSGIGMVYSLAKGKSLIDFYKKRLFRIYPTYIPWVFFYSIVCVIVGVCSMDVLLANCSGMGFWITDHEYAFNWYISAQLLFYLVSPLIYKLLENKKKRGIYSFFLGAFTILIILVFYDILKWRRLLIAICRFPIFITGFIVGFWIQEKKHLKKVELYSLVIILAGTMAFHFLDEMISIPLIGWHWMILGGIVPILCLFLSNLLRFLDRNSWGMKWLQWVGNNSLEIYMLNVIIVRFAKIFIPRDFKGDNILFKLIVVLAIIFNILFIYVKEKCVMRIKVNKKA